MAGVGDYLGYVQVCSSMQRDLSQLVMCAKQLAAGTQIAAERS